MAYPLLKKVECFCGHYRSLLLLLFLSLWFCSLFSCRVCSILSLEKRAYVPFFASLVAWERMPSQRHLSSLISLHSLGWLMGEEPPFCPLDPSSEIWKLPFRRKIRGFGYQNPFSTYFNILSDMFGRSARAVFPEICFTLFVWSFHQLSPLSISTKVYVRVSRVFYFLVITSLDRFNCVSISHVLFFHNGLTFTLFYIVLFGSTV